MHTDSEMRSRHTLHTPTSAPSGNAYRQCSLPVPRSQSHIRPVDTRTQDAECICVHAHAHTPTRTRTHANKAGGRVQSRFADSCSSRPLSWILRRVARPPSEYPRGHASLGWQCRHLLLAAATVGLDLVEAALDARKDHRRCTEERPHLRFRRLRRLRWDGK